MALSLAQRVQIAPPVHLVLKARQRSQAWLVLGARVRIRSGVLPVVGVLPSCGVAIQSCQRRRFVAPLYIRRYGQYSGRVLLLVRPDYPPHADVAWYGRTGNHAPASLKRVRVGSQWSTGTVCDYCATCLMLRLRRTGVRPVKQQVQ